MPDDTSNSEYRKQYQRFASRLRDARKEAGFTQVEVADLLNTTQSYISKYERGELRLDIVQLVPFARLYGKSLEYFIEELEN